MNMSLIKRFGPKNSQRPCFTASTAGILLILYSGITTDKAAKNAPVYNLAGQKVTKAYKGVVNIIWIARNLVISVRLNS